MWICVGCWALLGIAGQGRRRFEDGTTSFDLLDDFAATITVTEAPSSRQDASQKGSDQREPIRNGEGEADYTERARLAGATFEIGETLKENWQQRLHLGPPTVIISPSSTRPILAKLGTWWLYRRKRAFHIQYTHIEGNA